MKKSNSQVQQINTISICKKQSMEIQEENDYFSTLNDDCIFELFKRLSMISDLVAVGQTCKKLKRLIGNYIQNRYPFLIPKSLTIVSTNGIVDFDRKDNYIKCISQNVESIHIVGNNGSCDRFIQFIQTNCGQNVETLKLHNSNGSETFSEGIKRVLENVKIVKFVDSKGFDHILVKCKNVQYLQVCNWNVSTKLPRNSYPTLKVFKLFNFKYDSAPWDELTTFFQRNPNVKRFICVNNLKTLLTKRLLSILIENGNIDELFIQLLRIDTDFGVIYKELKKLTDRTNFKRLEIKFDCQYGEFPQTINVLSPLQHFTGLHLENWNPSLVNLSYLINLKILRLSNCSLDGKAATAIAHRLQSLEQFHYRINTATQVRECIKPFARYAKKLTEMAIICAKIEDNHEDISKLNGERRKLANASKLIIFIKGSSRFNWNFKHLNVTDKDMVDFKTVVVRDDIHDVESNSPLNEYYLE